MSLKVQRELHIVSRAITLALPVIPKKSLYRSLAYELLALDDRMKVARFLRLKNRLMRSPFLQEFWKKGGR